MNKTIKDLTILEIFEMRCSDSSCKGCPFYKKVLIKNDDGFCWNNIPYTTEKQCFLKAIDPHMWDVKQYEEKFNQEIVIEEEINEQN